MRSLHLDISATVGVGEFAALQGCVLSAGNFDGVHLGHRAIIDAMKAAVRLSGRADPLSPIVAVTFEPHPTEVLRPELAPKRLTPWREKVRQLAAAGVDTVVGLKAEAALFALEPEAFVADVLVKYLHPTCIVEGGDFGFGRGRRGDVAMLQTLATQHGYRVQIVPPVEVALPDGTRARVSSTAIRERVSAGAMEAATVLLGRPFALVGGVVKGAGAGRTLGYPTINLDVGHQVIPAEGVYAGWGEIDGARYRAAISVGMRSTLGGATLAIEAFLLDASGDWYGREARLELHTRLRGQEKFASVDALVEQIGRDVADVRRRLAD